MRKSFQTCLSLLIFIGIITVPFSNAATSDQWFPQSGTTCDYSLSWFVTYKNGTRLNATEFNIYNASSAILMIVPLALDPDFNVNLRITDWSPIANKVSVTFRHSYSEESASTWIRALIINAGNYSYSHIPVQIVMDWRLGVYRGAIINTTDDSVQKQGYFSSANSFVDYFNQELQPWEAFTSPYISFPTVIQNPTYIIAKSSSNVAAMWSYVDTMISSPCNGTYIADTSGRVESYSFMLKDEISFPQHVAYGYSYSRLPDAISAPGIEWILISLSLGVCITFWLWKRRLR